MFNQLFNLGKKSVENRYSINNPDSALRLSISLKDIITTAGINLDRIIILCIGTDRSTGDALGPLTGTKLKSLRAHPHIFGTLEEPVHATNLPDTLNRINKDFSQPFIIAIDACLGKPDSIGFVSLGKGSLKPGAAVNKDLPLVGDAYITGTVNVGGFMEHIVLQSTRLSLVVRMADVIAHSLAYSLYEKH